VLSSAVSEAGARFPAMERESQGREKRKRRRKIKLIFFLNKIIN
jgi:hypothetical protein